MSLKKSAAVGTGLLTVIYLGFISLGMPDGILGAAWPKMRADFGLELSANWPVLMLCTLGGAVSSFLSGRILARFGVGPVLAVSGLLTGLSILGYGIVPVWWMFVILALPFGAGAGSVDSGMNSFTAKHLTSRHMNWLHAFWGVGVSVGVGILSGVFQLGGTWRWAYVLIGVLQLALATVFFCTLKKWDAANGEGQTTPVEHASLRATLRLPAAWAGLLIYLMYAGVECNMGVWSASLLVNKRGWSAAEAGMMLTLYWGALTAGRFVLGAVANRLGNHRLFVMGCAGMAVGAVLLIVSGHLPGATAGGTAVAAAMLVNGFFCGPIYPCAMHATPERVPAEHVQNMIGLQVGTAIIGMAVMPVAGGFTLQRFGLELLGPIVLACALILWTVSPLIKSRKKAA